MIENSILVLTLILIGSAMRYSSRFPKTTADVLNAFVINISLPAMILISIPKLPWSEQALIPVASHWLVYLVNLALLLLASKIFKFTKSVIGVLVVVATMGNTAFLGIPVISIYFGEHALGYAVLYDQLGSGIIFLITSAMIVPYYLGQKISRPKDVLKILFKFPPFLAVLGGFLLKLYPMPSLLGSTVEKISYTLIPCAMIAVGYQMKYRINIQKFIPISLALFIKLLLVPMVFLGITKAMNFSNLALDVSIIQSAMPPMVTAGAVAMSANLEKDIAAALVGYGLLLSFITLPLLKMVV